MEIRDIEILLNIPGGNEFVNAFLACSKKGSTLNVIISTEDIKDKFVAVSMFNGRFIAEIGKVIGRTDFYYIKDITEIKLPSLNVA